MITCHQDHSERKYKTKPQYRHCLAFHQFKDIKCRNEPAPPPIKGGPSAMIGRILDADISQQCQIEQGYQNPAQYAHILHGWLLNHFASNTFIRPKSTRSKSSADNETSSSMFVGHNSIFDERSRESEHPSNMQMPNGNIRVRQLTFICNIPYFANSKI